MLSASEKKTLGHVYDRVLRPPSEAEKAVAQSVFDRAASKRGLTTEQLVAHVRGRQPKAKAFSTNPNDFFNEVKTTPKPKAVKLKRFSFVCHDGIGGIEYSFLQSVICKITKNNAKAPVNRKQNSKVFEYLLTEAEFIKAKELHDKICDSFHKKVDDLVVQHKKEFKLG